MNPYGITGSCIDKVAITTWNAKNARARREYEDQPIAACLAPGCFELGAIEAGFCFEDAIRHNLCAQCQRRTPEGKRLRCRTCRKGGHQTAAERMRLRRAKAKVEGW